MNNKRNTLVNTAFSKSIIAKCQVLSVFFAFLSPVSAFANGLGENVPYRFDQKDRISMMEMQLLKESGFYDSQAAAGGAGGGNGDTIIHGDQINCIIQSSTLANSNGSGLESFTGSLTGVSDGNVGATANANESDTYGRGGGELNLGQENSGSQEANISDSNMNSHVGEFTGGGTSEQSVRTEQSNDGSTLRASITDATVCDNVTTN